MSSDENVTEIASLVGSSLSGLLPHEGAVRNAGKSLCQRLKDDELSNPLNQVALRKLAKSLLMELSSESEGEGDAPSED